MASKVAYVTGGMGGIGTAICQRLSKEGFKVIAGCGPSRDFKKWIDEQKVLGYTFYTSVGNVADWESTVAAFTRAKQRAFFTLCVERGQPVTWIENLLAPAGVRRINSAGLIDE